MAKVSNFQTRTLRALGVAHFKTVQQQFEADGFLGLIDDAPADAIMEREEDERRELAWELACDTFWIDLTPGGIQ